ncbi:transcriptional regulator [Pedobacter aquatilis]|uniref:transcriptional regulator n=1 Tax=Pedobacter aquatilis TaxID=351343 RepID=UPI0025B42C40|nr:transcriptional regulator [Pedobacter aquatilis]MDN3587108.1 transcriptional regulator [Pedobacter aquatilis]
MENYFLSADLRMMYIEAATFPDGVEAAHKKLHALVAFDIKRRYFGYSRLENEIIIYKAGAEELNTGEGKILGLDTLLIQQGKFASKLVANFMDDVSVIGSTFQELLRHPNLDPNGYCLEIYQNTKDVLCLVRLKD